jgi:hypothetical protein
MWQRSVSHCSRDVHAFICAAVHLSTAIYSAEVLFAFKQFGQLPASLLSCSHASSLVGKLLLHTSEGAGAQHRQLPHDGVVAR